MDMSDESDAAIGATDEDVGGVQEDAPKRCSKMRRQRPQESGQQDGADCVTSLTFTFRFPFSRIRLFASPGPHTFNGALIDCVVPPSLVDVQLDVCNENHCFGAVSRERSWHSD